MSYLEILRWVNIALSVLSVENIQALFDLIESTMNSIDKFLEKVGIAVPVIENMEVVSDEERALENTIATQLMTTNAGTMPGPAAAFDFSRIRKLLKRAMDSGLLDVFLAGLVGKVPLQVNMNATGEGESATAVPSGVAQPDLNQKK